MALHLLSFNSHAQPWTAAAAAAAARLLLASGHRTVRTSASRTMAMYDSQTPAQAAPVTARGGELHRLLLEAEGA